MVSLENCRFKLDNYSYSILNDRFLQSINLQTSNEHWKKIYNNEVLLKNVNERMKLVRHESIKHFKELAKILGGEEATRLTYFNHYQRQPDESIYDEVNCCNSHRPEKENVEPLRNYHIFDIENIL